MDGGENYEKWPKSKTKFIERIHDQTRRPIKLQKKRTIKVTPSASLKDEVKASWLTTLLWQVPSSVLGEVYQQAMSNAFHRHNAHSQR